MLRKTAVSKIPQFNFGHPSLKQHFGAVSTPVNATLADSGVQRTKLPNGVTVVTRDVSGANSTFGFYADAGAKYDPVEAPGLSYVMRWAIQTSNMDNSLFQLDRTMRSHGFSYGHGEIRKQFLSWKGEGRRDMLEKPFKTFATCISAPRFHEADIERFRDTMDNLLEEQRFQNPRDYCVDQLETLAFYKEPLGNPRHVWENSNDKANSTALLNHWASYFTPQRITVAGVNVAHDQLVSLYSNAEFPHSHEAPHHARARRPSPVDKNEALQFVPGKQGSEVEARAKHTGTSPDMDSEIISAFAWPTYGRDGSLSEYAAAAVAAEVLAAATADGIQYDRYSNHKGIRSFYRPYSTTGLVGFTVRGTDEEALRQAQRAIEVFTTFKPTDDMVKTGISRAQVRMYHNDLERVADYTDFLATSPNTEDEILAALKNVDTAAVTAALKGLSTIKPATFTTGDCNAWPSLKQFGWK